MFVVTSFCHCFDDTLIIKNLNSISVKVCTTKCHRSNGIVCYHDNSFQMAKISAVDTVP